MKKQALLLFGISVFWLALSMVSDGVSTLLLPGIILTRFDSSSATVLGLITFAGILAGMLVQPYAGAWSDRLRNRWGRKGMIGVGVILLVVSLAVTGVADALLVLLLGYLLIQLSLNLAQAAQQGFVPDLVDAANRGTASGLKFFMDMTGAMIGFILLGQLIGSGGTPAAIIALSLALIVTFGLTALLVREPKEKPAHGASGSFSRKHISFTEVFRIDLHQHRRFAWLVVARFLFLLGTFAVGRFLMLYVASRLSLAPEDAAEQTGWLLAGLALVTVLAAIPAGRAADRYGRVPLMLIGSGLSGLGVLLLIFASSPIQILVFGALMSVGNAAFVGANWALTADLVPGDQAARFFGLANFGTGGATAAAGLFGPMVDWGNLYQPGAGFTLLFMAAALAFLLSGMTLSMVIGGKELSFLPGFDKNTPINLPVKIKNRR